MGEACSLAQFVRSDSAILLCQRDNFPPPACIPWQPAFRGLFYSQCYVPQSELGLTNEAQNRDTSSIHYTAILTNSFSAMPHYFICHLFKTHLSMMCCKMCLCWIKPPYYQTINSCNIIFAVQVIGTCNLYIMCVHNNKIQF